MGRAGAGFVLLILAGAQPVQAQKTDVITLQNGDEITGEIKRLDRGKLEYKTDDMGTVEIEWDKVQRVTSIWFFEVELSSGQRYFGSFPDGAELGTVLVELTPSLDTLSLTSIVRIQPIEASFWAQLDGFVDMGFNYARANRNFQFTSSARANYRGLRWGGTARGESYNQTQTNSNGTARNSVDFSVERYFEESLWSAWFFTGAEQNTEFNLALRGTFGGGTFRTLRQSTRSLMRMSGGLSLAGERFTTDTATPGAQEPNVYSLEGVLQFEWAVFKFAPPELDVLTWIQATPSLTDLGRIRYDIDVRVRYELVKDFFLSLSGNLRLDSRPPSMDASRVDFWTTFTLGWSF